MSQTCVPTLAVQAHVLLCMAKGDISLLGQLGGSARPAGSGGYALLGRLGRDACAAPLLTSYRVLGKCEQRVRSVRKQGGCSRLPLPKEHLHPRPSPSLCSEET